MKKSMKNMVSPLLGVVTLMLLVMFYTKSVEAENQSGHMLLQVSHARTGEILYVKPVQVDDEICLGWIHSVELTPWQEYYRILETGELLLTTTRFQSYGAGVPEYGGIFRKEKDWIVYENINRVLPALQWIHSQAARFKLEYNRHVILKSKDLPHHEPLKLTIIRDMQ